MIQFFKTTLRGIRYFWMLTRNSECSWWQVYRPAFWKYRLRPWTSKYWRWRLFTVYGPEAQGLTGRKFYALLWKDRKQVWDFTKWVEEMQPHE